MTRRVFRCTTLCVLCSIVVPVSVGADDQPAWTPGPDEPAVSVKDGRVLRAFPVTGARPRIDGRLDDEVWEVAERATGFVQWDPDNMAPMTDQTIMQVAYDRDYLYALVRCNDRVPADITTGLGRRDEFLQTDLVTVAFDPRHDHQTGYSFMANPSGSQIDGYMYNDEQFDRDFDAVWEVRTSITADGWIAEYRIPFSQMRFTASPEPGQVWGFSSRRTIHRRSEMGEWTGKPRGEAGSVSRWGHLIFGAPLDPPRRVELQPYALAGGSRQSASGGNFTGSAGLDLRVGLGTGATLSATVNPDFAQVEQDPAVLNLTVFETFFPEKRPFFLEDGRTFVPPYERFQLFHSRRIGRRPDRFPLEADDRVVDRPEQATIVGAAKITGKGGGWTYGAMTALTGREHAVLDSGEGGRSVERLIEPATSYNVARLQRDVRRGSSNVGVIATGVVRAGDLDAYTGGGDYNLRWDRNRTNLNGHWVVTRAPISGVARTGFGGTTDFNFSRKHVGAFGHFDHFDREFRVDDVGFFRDRPNRTAFDGGWHLKQPDPWKAFRQLHLSAGGGQSWAGDGLVFSRALNAHTSLEFRNYWLIEAGYERAFEVLDDLDTRGGPPIVRPASHGMYVGVGSDSRKTWGLSMIGNMRRDGAGGWASRLGPSLNLRPSGRVQASISASYDFGRDIAQWITNTDVDRDGTVDHVYGTLERDVLDVTLRSTYAIHRDLTVQLFLQPFVAAGNYADIRRLAAPRSFLFEPVRLDEAPDFNRKSLRGNVVLRWEYLRGSVLYVAWNLATSDTSRPGTFDPLRDLGDAFDGVGTHALTVKVSYWLSR